MNYLLELHKKINKYKKKKYGKFFTLVKLVFINFRMFFKNVDFSTDLVSDLSIQNDTQSRKLVIAIRCNGGVGNVLINANFIKILYDKIKNDDIDFVIFGHPIKECNDAIFKDQYFVTRYYNYTELKKDDFPYYDCVIEIHSFPDIVKANFSKIHAVSVELYNILLAWNKFRKDDAFCRMYTNRPRMNANIYKYGILNKKNCLNIADIDGLLEVPDDSYSLDLNICKDEDLYLKEIGLYNTKFITLQRGCNPFSGTKESPKLWPVEYYEELILKLKNKYQDDIKLVQIGEDVTRCEILKGVDLNLVGRTDWDELKIILKHAVYHIDGECGMVHVRKALKAGPSVVLFGPTPERFFSYASNINVSAHVCKACAALTDLWQKECIKGEACCMSSLTPQMVIDAIDSYENKKASDGLVSEVQSTEESFSPVVRNILKEDICFDKKWFFSFISNIDIWAYEFVDLPLSSLKITYLVGDKWNLFDISEAYEIDYLKGNKKPYLDYIKFKNFNYPGDDNSEKRFDQLISDLEKNGIDSNFVVPISYSGVILDGKHRAAYMYYKNPNAIVRCLKIYF